MIEILITLAMILTRLSAFFLIVPIFSWRAIPMAMKMALIVMLTLVFGYMAPSPLNLASLSPVYILLIMVNEATYGIALALIIMVLFSVVSCAGNIIERQLGFTMAQIIDPMSGTSSQPMGGFLQMLFILLLLHVQAHHAFLRIIYRSYETFPIGTMPSIELLTAAVVKTTSMLLTYSLRLAAPVLAMFLILLVVLGIMARVVPEMNVLFISMPVRVALGLVISIVMLPFILEFVSEFSDLMNKLVPI